MKRDLPGPDATNEQLTAFIHDCIDRGFESAKRKSWAILIALGMLILASLAMGGGLLTQGYRVVQWTDGVNSRLDALTAAGAYRDRRLDSIDVTLQDLRGVAHSNRETLLGTYHTAKGQRR